MLNNIKTFFANKNENILSFLYSLNINIDWQQEINKGKIRVGKYFVKSKFNLKIGNKITYDPDKQIPEPPIKTNYQIIYEDEDLVAINKPAPLPIHPSGSYFSNTLTEILKTENKNWYTIHRLDSETSGILLLAKNPAHIKQYTISLKQAQKIYLVMVVGKPPKRWEVSMLLGHKKNSLVHKRQGYNPTGKESRTVFKRICYQKGTFFKNSKSLLFAYPYSGRTHQIRAHLNENGYPVIGDKIYGENENYFIDFIKNGWNKKLQKKLLLKRQFLHCYKIIFFHPFNKKKIIFKTNLSQELRDYLNKEYLNYQKSTKK
jgi:RluA family pseudouridine synthase